ncbi:sporulation histidine kinase inhibitor Sda [Paenibacillus sp. y28]|uniref:sporulation histidine kinase inhibitor Sda n=1 Tax=Paenibacillus sp. y28 TaxID=3129110 RepID=UPI00301934B5
MRLLTDEALIECYAKAIYLQLEPDFIRMLENEIQRRQLQIPAFPALKAQAN